jgi:hypothetical protein
MGKPFLRAVRRGKDNAPEARNFEGACGQGRTESRCLLRKAESSLGASLNEREAKMSAPVQPCPLESLVVVIVRELAGAGMQQPARTVLTQAVEVLGHDAADALWFDLYGRELFSDD